MSKCKDDAAHAYHRKLDEELQAILTGESRCAVELSAWLTQDADHMAMGIIVLVDGVEKIARMAPQVEIINLEEALGLKPDSHN